MRSSTSSMPTERRTRSSLRCAASSCSAFSCECVVDRIVRAREELTAAAPVLRKVRLLDQQLAERKKAAAEAEEACARDKAKLGAVRQTLKYAFKVTLHLSH